MKEDNVTVAIPVPMEGLKATLMSMAEDVAREARENALELKPYNSPQEVCRALNVSQSTLNKWHKMGLKRHVIDQKVFYKRKSIENFLDQYEVQA